jgi:molybdate transport system substrate-binding protein
MSLRPLLALILLLALPLRGAEIHLAAAASLSDVLEELAPLYERASGHRIVLNLGGSSVLARQIGNGAPADVFLSADEAKMDELARAGLVVRETRVSLLSNTLVVVVPDDAKRIPRSADDLATVASLALAEPSSVPAGIYARRWLERRGLWRRVARRVIPTDNVRGALAAVEAGNAAAAIVYRTDLRAARRVRVAFTIDGPEAPAISYPLAVLRDAAQPRAARHLVQWLAGPAARAVFVKHGFVVRAR